MKKLIAMKRIFYILLIGLLTTGLQSCEKFFDVNISPNNPSTAPYSRVHPRAVITTAAVTGGQYAILGSLWSEHFTQSNTAQQYLEWVYYNVTPDVFNSSFNTLYNTALKNYDIVKKDAAAAGDWNYYLMATVMECYTYQILADLHDQIPFTEALQGLEGNFAPKYDAGATVYDGLITRLDEALSKGFSSNSFGNPGANDQIFGGDMDKWVQFANTLKLKIYMRQVYAREDVSKAGFTALLADNNFLQEDAKLDKFIDETGKQNPLYGSEVAGTGLGGPNIRGCNTFLNFMQGNGDTRLPKIYAYASGTTYKGIDFGSRPTSVEVPNNTLSRGQFTATDPVVFISKAESQFLQAEAKEWTGADGKVNYDAGVTASFEKYGLDGSSFIAGSGVYEYPSAGTFEEKQEAIIIQKWVDCAIRNPIESFFEFNRTGYPDTDILIVSVGTKIGSNYPKRLPFASFDQQRNNNTPPQVRIDVPVWWDKK